MAKRSILKFLSCLTLWFAGQVFAVESAGVLPAEQAFQFTYQVQKADRLLLSWDIATGYYLYRHKFKFVSLAPGITVTQNTPTDHALLRQFNLIGPPAILFFGPDQQERSAYRVVGYLKADRFLDIINRVFPKPVY